MVRKVNVYSLDAKEKDSIELPIIFDIKPRKDIIARAVQSIESNSKQPQGRDPMAGKRVVAESWGSGYGVARIPRIKGSGFPNARNAGFIPRTVGGRLAWPPTSKKNIKKKINKKEKKLALFHAISATSIKELVQKRGHRIDKVPEIPLIIDDKIQALKKTSDVIKTFKKLGIFEDIEKVKETKKIRAGKGKRRGRKYKARKSLLLVIKDDFGIIKAARNIEGVDIVNIFKLNTKDLAPGALMGRLTIWTQSAINEIKKWSDKYGTLL